jgi:hypothetical protein
MFSEERILTWKKKIRRGCEDVEMWRCGDVEMWKCGNVEM